MRVFLTALLVIGCAGVSSKPLAPEQPAPEAPISKAAQSSPPSQLAEPAPEPNAQKESPAPPLASAEVAAPSAPPAEPPASPSKPATTVQLLSPGAEPRRPLRYVFHRGENMKFRLHQDMTMESVIEVPGVGSTLPPQTVRVILPTTECEGVTRTKAVDADGTAHREGWLGGFKILRTPGVEPEVEQKMIDIFHGVGKLPYDDVMNTRGEVLEYHMDLSGVSDPTLLESMQQASDNMSALMAPWPVEPVGVGAKWQSTSSLKMSGGQFARTTVVTLKSLRGSKAKLEMAITLLGAPHSVVKNGMSVDIGETRTVANAQLDVTLDPVASQSKSSSETHTDSTASGVHVRMKLNIESLTTYGP